MTSLDAVWMQRALEEAVRGRGAVEPNPMVGALLVREGRVVGVGHHARFGGPHAEVAAIQDAGEAASGSTLYVTLEPCCHHGKTPPCTNAIIAAGIIRVVAATRDPFPRVDGGGLSRLRSAGILVDLGVMASTALILNEPYFKRVITGMPYVIAKWAMTLDGKTAVATGDSRWISSPSSRELVHDLRGRVDAILVGIGTALADDPQLTARPPGPRRAARIVLDNLARLPVDSLLVRTITDAPVVVAATDRAPAERCAALREKGCEVLIFPGARHVPISPLLAELGRRDMTNLMIEGGGQVVGSFLDEGQLDELDVYLAPLLEGGDHARTPARGIGLEQMSHALRIESVKYSQSGVDLRIQGRLPRQWRANLAELELDREADRP